jgi:hypothetical protein
MANGKKWQKCFLSRHVRLKIGHFFKSYHPTYTLAGFDLTTPVSSVAGGDCALVLAVLLPVAPKLGTVSPIPVEKNTP